MGAEEPVTVEHTTVLDPATHSTASSARALADLEAQRVRGLMKGICGSAALTTVLVILLGGDPVALRIHASALAATALASGLTVILLRNPKPFHVRLSLYVVLAQVAVLCTGYYFWGVFSTYGALVPLTIYIAAANITKLEVIFGTAACVTAQAGFALATSLGWIESRGLVEPVPSRAPLRTEIVAIVLIQVITIGAALAGRAARRDSLAVLEQHNRALIDLARREAQLAEAYADARAAREGDRGGFGRFTDQTIDDFKLGRVLGRGAMGEIYEATRAGGAAPVAVKILAPHLLRDRSARERFLRESTIVSRLQSPHVVRVLAVSSPDALVPYIAMERLEGTDLAQMLKRQPVMPLPELLELVEQVAAGLDAAHAAGVIHRDLKPSNLYAIGAPGRRTWKLLDFGASKWQDGQGTLTQDRLVGTPGYMAPEQATGRPVDQRSDVYAFGVILYRALTGVPAVVPDEVPAVLQEVAYRMPPQPSRRAPQITPPVEAVLAVALAKDPDDRFRSAGELGAVFAAACEGRVAPALASRAAAILRQTPWGEWRDRRQREIADGA